MKKINLLAIAIIISLSTYAQNNMKTIYNFKVKSIDGKEYDMASLKGKKLVIVNTASECGNTPQYAELEALSKKYKKVVFIGFPANNFGGQEPGTDAEIKTFCTKQYAVTFPMMSKISVKGKEIAPIYSWLTEKASNGVADAPVTWNFQKFLIDENGHWVASVAPGTAPSKSK